METVRKLYYNECMPYDYTHALAARAALEKTTEKARALAEKQRSAFYIGSLGPDPYYGDALLPLPPWNVRGDLADGLHAAMPRDVFGAMLPLCAGSAARTAYMLGFACHLALDAAAHPYIEGRFPGALHSPAEIAMDAPMVRRAGGWPGVPPRRFYRTRDLSALDGLHAGLVDALYHEASTGAFRRTFRKWIAINTITFDPYGRKDRLLSPFTKATRFLVGPRSEAETARLLNLDHAVWYAPGRPDTPRTESFPELAEKGAENAARVIALLAEAADGGDEGAALDAAQKWCADAT